MTVRELVKALNTYDLDMPVELEIDDVDGMRTAQVDDFTVQYGTLYIVGNV